MIRLFLRKTDRPRQEHSAAGRALLEELLRDEFGMKVPEIRKNDYGKPYFAENPIYFSISHTDGFLAVAISDGEVGVDIQCFRPISADAIERFLGVREQDPVRRIELWVEYEAYAKFLGCGIPIRLPERPHDIRSLNCGSFALSICTEHGGMDSMPAIEWR